ncbi:hypothetical protein [Sporosarcina sp. A2]|uniref:hypothetical protein n=1 Tax=Sporosarcina sp. A2 TaxID=3393449 RepID=UPI003D7ACFCA
MKRKDWILMGLILFFITVIMAYDFFPKLNNLVSIPQPVVIGLIVLSLLLGFFVTRLQKDNSPRVKFMWQVAFMSYLVGLIIVFTLLGGVSQVGISVSSPALWIVLAISVGEILHEYKKLKAAQLVA